MSYPKTGQLGGFGITTLGGKPEQGDFLEWQPGLIRHFRFHEASSSTTAHSSVGGDPLVSAPWGSGPQDPVFGVDGSSFKAASLPEYIGDSSGVSHASFIDGAASGTWATALANGGTIEFWFKLSELPAVTWGTTGNVTTYYLDGTGALQSEPYPYVGTMNVLSVLSIGDPTNDHVLVFPSTGTGPSRPTPFMHIQVEPIFSNGGDVDYWLAGNGFGFGSVSDMAWHHVKVSWSNTHNFIHSYLDGTPVTSYGGFNKTPSSGAKLRLGGNDWGTPMGSYGAPYVQVNAPADVYVGNPAGWVEGLLLVGGGASFAIEDLAIYNGPVDLSTYRAPIYVSASSSMSVSGGGYLTGPIYISQGFAEVVNDKTRNLRVSQNFMEVIRTGNFAGRISQAFIEVLAPLPLPKWNVSATTNLTVAANAHGVVGHNFGVSATSNLVLTPSAAEHVPVALSVASTTNFTITGSGGAVYHVPTPYGVSASNTFSIHPTASESLARKINLLASTNLLVTSSCYSPVSRSVSAANSFFIYGTDTNSYDNHIFLSASTTFSVKATAPKPFSYGDKPVSAASSFSMSQLATNSNFGPRYVSASTGLSLASVATLGRLAILNVSASNVFVVKGNGREIGDFSPTASTSFLLTSSSKQNRDIQALAMTSMGLSNNPNTRNLKPVDASNTMIFTASAGIDVTGTEAASNLTFVDLAQAVVWIPWRRAGLTLPPGGNLPHS